MEIYCPDRDPLLLTVRMIKEQDQSYWFRINDAVDLIVDHKHRQIRLIPGFVPEHERLYLLIYTIWMKLIRNIYNLDDKPTISSLVYPTSAKSKLKAYHECAAPIINAWAAKCFLPLFPEKGYPEELRMSFAGLDFGAVRARNKRPIRTITTRIMRLFHSQPYLWYEVGDILMNSYSSLSYRNTFYYRDNMHNRLRLRKLHSWLFRRVSHEDHFNLVDILGSHLQTAAKGFMNSLAELHYKSAWLDFWNAHASNIYIPEWIKLNGFSTDTVLRAARNYLQASFEHLLWDEPLLAKSTKYKENRSPLLILMFADWPFQILPFGPISFTELKRHESFVLSSLVNVFYRTAQDRKRKMLKMLVLLYAGSEHSELASEEPGFEFLSTLWSLMRNRFWLSPTTPESPQHPVLATLSRKYRWPRLCLKLLDLTLQRLVHVDKLVASPEFEPLLQALVPYLDVTVDRLVKLADSR